MSSRALGIIDEARNRRRTGEKRDDEYCIIRRYVDTSIRLPKSSILNKKSPKRRQGGSPLRDFHLARDGKRANTNLRHLACDCKRANTNLRHLARDGKRAKTMRSQNKDKPNMQNPTKSCKIQEMKNRKSRGPISSDSGIEPGFGISASKCVLLGYFLTSLFSGQQKSKKVGRCRGLQPAELEMSWIANGLEVSPLYML